MTAQESLISVLDACDNFRPHFSQEPLVPFLLTPETRPAIGLLRPSVVAALRADNAWRSANGHPHAWDIPASASGSSTDTPPYIALAPTLAQGSPAARTIALVETLDRWRADANAGEGVGCAFADVIGDKRWRGEWYVHVASSSVLRADGRDPLTLLEVAPATATAPESGLSSGKTGYAFSMERVACKLFGVVTYGVHMTVYEQRKGDVGVDANGVRVWFRGAPRQSRRGIAGGMSAFDTLVKEAEEEASLNPELVRKRAHAVVAISHFYRTKAGWLQPQVTFVYDMHVEPGEVQLSPMDGEVESFELMSVDEVVSCMRAGKFKPNCGLVLLDFLVRRGYLTSENEPRFLEINQRLHGRFDVERW